MEKIWMSYPTVYQQHILIKGMIMCNEKVISLISDLSDKYLDEELKNLKIKLVLKDSVNLEVKKTMSKYPMIYVKE